MFTGALLYLCVMNSKDIKSDYRLDMQFNYKKIDLNLRYSLTS